jgi:hypothetical protein
MLESQRNEVLAIAMTASWTTVDIGETHVSHHTILLALDPQVHLSPELEHTHCAQSYCTRCLCDTGVHKPLHTDSNLNKQY